MAITKTLKKMGEDVARISSGDFVTKIKADSIIVEFQEILQGLESMRHELRNALVKVIDHADTVNTKAELAKYIEQHDGLLAVNTSSDGAKRIFDVAKCKKISIGEGQANICADNIISTKKGSEFDIVIDGKCIGKAETVLLGEHNVYNILTAVAVARELKLSDKQIIDGIKHVIPVSHRLAIVPSNNALVVIDDAYNGSVEGTKSALNVLAKFEGKKIVITPGLVELGTEQFNCNFEFGRDMAKVCDYVIVTGVINWDAISNGLEFAGFDKSKIIRAGSLNQAVAMLPSITNPGDVVLFENDLPDNYL